MRNSGLAAATCALAFLSAACTHAPRSGPRALHSDGPAADSADALALYAFLSGTGRPASSPTRRTAPARSRGEIHAGWVPRTRSRMSG
jgi:hypothetical protein